MLAAVNKRNSHQMSLKPTVYETIISKTKKNLIRERERKCQTHRNRNTLKAKEKNNDGRRRGEHAAQSTVGS